ncbi:flagellar hook-associated protein FlgL [Blastococcus sp. BMG 814]|uniref:Flagellar hook-associated protein FlgL n=1 Tax=Blastococcus carthaginiensis TaxID=3050034 RepID=A0ABT9IFF5_9ACTN|nr:flagellar hook-associated protein FlgL [Blastococcus carthaginiensis]MDP5184303.1 flagellar hook-associated protein FlgL [Blastococcus carthaginiensis]
MRITQRAVTLTSLQGLNRNLESFSKLQEQLTSGRVLSAPSDSPTGTNRAMQTRGEQDATAQYARNISDGQAWLNQTDSTLQRMLEVTRRVRDLTVQGSNTGAMSDTARQALASETAALRDSLLGLANTTVAGRPLFGGITAGPKAYDSVTGAYVGQAGPGAEVLRRVSSTDSVRVDVSGPEAFEADGVDLFSLVGRITSNLTADPVGLVQDLADLDLVMNKMSSALADVGARSSRIDGEAQINMDQGIALQTRLGEVEDIDLPNTIMRLQMQQAGYEAALSATAKAISPTLMDYLR